MPVSVPRNLVKLREQHEQAWTRMFRSVLCWKKLTVSRVSQKKGKQVLSVGNVFLPAHHDSCSLECWSYRGKSKQNNAVTVSVPYLINPSPCSNWCGIKDTTERISATHPASHHWTKHHEGQRCYLEKPCLADIISVQPHHWTFWSSNVRDRDVIYPGCHHWTLGVTLWWTEVLFHEALWGIAVTPVQPITTGPSGVPLRWSEVLFGKALWGMEVPSVQHVTTGPSP